MCKQIYLLLLLTACLSVPAYATDESADAEIIALEIRNLSSSVDRLTQLIYAQTEQKDSDTVLRKLDIAVAYLNFRSRRIEQLERDKQRTSVSKTRLEDVIRQWEQRVEQLSESDNNSQAADNNKQAKQEAQEQLKMLKQRLTRVDSEALDFANRIAELQSQLDSVEGFVERNLELR